MAEEQRLHGRKPHGDGDRIADKRGRQNLLAAAHHRDPPDLQQIANRQFETHCEEQEDQPDVGERTDRAEVGDGTNGVRADHESSDYVTEDRRLAEAATAAPMAAAIRASASATRNPVSVMAYSQSEGRHLMVTVSHRTGRGHFLR